jgi:hypothetical protein
MLVLVRDYLAYKRKEILTDLMWVYVATVALATGVVLRVWAQEKMIHLSGMQFVGLVIVFPIVFVCLLHLLSIWLVGRNLARSAGLSLRDYVKSEAYRQNGREVLRDFWRGR